MRRIDTEIEVSLEVVCEENTVDLLAALLFVTLASVGLERKQTLD